MKKKEPEFKEIEISSPKTPEIVIAATTCPKCGAATKFCPSCGGRFCDTEGCSAADPYHREECRDSVNVGD